MPPAALSTNGEPGSFEPTWLKLPYVPQLPSFLPFDEDSVADARSSCAPVAATPEPESVPLASEMLSVVEAEYRPAVPVSPLASTDPPLGPLESLTKFKAVEAKLSATLRPVIVSLGEVVVPALQLNALDTYGP